MEHGDGSTFRIGINMPGAISAGAYTAGVLDFLTQALDEWEAAKARHEPVPRHSVSIDVLSGASAGGMCAAIAAVALHEKFPHITPAAGDEAKARNKFYKSWVQDIDISSLLGAEDLADPGAPVVSLLDSSVIPRIAESAIANHGLSRTRNYVANDLALFLTLTNLRGVPYSIDPANQGSFEERILYFADQVQFQIVTNEGDSTLPGVVKALPLSGATQPWRFLRDVAVATGAFPLALAPRILGRDRCDYDDHRWTVAAEHPAAQNGCQCQEEKTIAPAWGSSPPPSLETLNVDGGATNNNPFELARKYLAERCGSDRNPREADQADRAVISIAPFPGQQGFDRHYDAKARQSLGSVLGSLVAALLAQSRFQGESLQLSKTSDQFSRFVVAPSDPSVGPSQAALMSAALGAFGGFLAREFREHDFQLGRYNCQYFLKEWFVLPAENRVISQGLSSADPSVVPRFRASGDPHFKRPGPHQTWMPIIPLCGSAAETVGGGVPPRRESISRAQVAAIADRCAQRLRALAPQLISANHSGLRALAKTAGWAGQWWLRSKAYNFLLESLKDSVTY